MEHNLVYILLLIYKKVVHRDVLVINATNIKVVSNNVVYIEMNIFIKVANRTTGKVHSFVSLDCN